MKTYMTALVRTEPMAVQTLEGFKCPDWCISDHQPEELTDWDTGLWLVAHEGREHRWDTARGTEMVAKLRFTEVVGWNMLPPDGYYTGPYIALEGDDGGDTMGTSEIDAADIAQWGAMLIRLGAEVLP